MTTEAERRVLVERAIREERCTCGAMRTAHEDRVLGGYVAQGHGAGPNGCPKYTWDGKSGPFAVHSPATN